MICRQCKLICVKRSLKRMQRLHGIMAASLVAVPLVMTETVRGQDLPDDAIPAFLASEATSFVLDHVVDGTVAPAREGRSLLLAAGVTTARTAGGLLPFDRNLEARIDAGRIVGPTLFVTAGYLENVLMLRHFTFNRFKRRTVAGRPDE
jgi:hypothetical protein